MGKLESMLKDLSFEDKSEHPLKASAKRVVVIIKS